ncbi:MAG: DUF4400 domain-containing protein [Azoarcus sp.]|jgi:hypothetical protein|nr:DUF4400 domain-containing protein [Azoarcus sp.]
MIRAILAASLMLLLIFVLYLPSANPPERFLARMRLEHRSNAAYWGNGPAMRIMERGLAMNAALSSASPVPDERSAPRFDPVQEAVGHEMGRVNKRFFGNGYFRAIDALLLLATYRVAALMEWLPIEAFALAALLLDGQFVRLRRSKEFVKHDPEWFALHASAFVLVACGSVVAFVTPIDIQPPLLGALPLVAGVFFSRVVANFHRRG